MMAAVAPSGRGSPRSRSAPSTFTMTAAWARRGPMGRARSVPVAPSGSCREEPSGSVIVIGPMDRAAYRRVDSRPSDLRASVGAEGVPEAGDGVDVLRAPQALAHRGDRQMGGTRGFPAGGL